METMEFDVLIVGGGPAGLAAAIRLKQRNAALSVCLIDKGAEIGAHILSGTVFDPRALDELLPDWPARNAPLDTPVSDEQFMLLGKHQARRIPAWLLPGCLHNAGNYIISLGALCRWLGQQAEALGVDIFPGFAAHSVLIENDQVVGVITGDHGRQADGTPGLRFASGMALRAKTTLFAEGCRGHLGKQLEQRFALRSSASAQTYGLGIKELWRIAPAQHHPGRVIHTVGWPLIQRLGAPYAARNLAPYGGGFCYHYTSPAGDRLLACGLVVGLDYQNPTLSPFDELQRLKTHPTLRPLFDGGERIGYGARALTTGGLQSLPKLTFPGGALIGDDAGFLVAARIKGAHAAMKSGMLAADAIADGAGGPAANAQSNDDALAAYPQRFRTSWLHAELYQTRNFKPLMAHGLFTGALLFGIDQHLLRGRAPWTLRHLAQENAWQPAAHCVLADTPKPDGRLIFDRLNSLALANVTHANDQPCHLHLQDVATPITLNLARYAAPETRYCPAAVYEIIEHGEHGAQQPQSVRLQINAQNCLHCKTCDILDPNIEWTPPQGGEGPLYQDM